MLSVLAAMPQDRGGLDANVIYIDTEAAFSATRLEINAMSYLSHRLQITVQFSYKDCSADYQSRPQGQVA